MKHLEVEIRGKGGGRSSKPLDKVGQSPKKKIFWPFRPQFGLKIMGARAPLPWIRHWFFLFKRGKIQQGHPKKNLSLQRGALTQTQPTTQAAFVGGEWFQLCFTPF